jgi:hypothetical protein
LSRNTDEAEAWLQRYLANEEMLGAELPHGAAVLADTFDLDRVWGPHEGPLLPTDLADRAAAEDWPESVTLLRTWLHQQSRSVRVLTQDFDEPREEALLEQLAALVRERVASGRIEDETHFIAQQLSRGEPSIWSVYNDPAGRPAPSLLAGLMTQPTTHAQHPLENQFSEALSFLISRWPKFAASFAARCGDENDRQLRASVDAAKSIGARTRLSLPVRHSANGAKRGFLFPDISIEGSDRTFQVLLEVKIDAEPHYAVVGGIKLLQPDAYASAWRRLINPSPARTRRVCTLTRDRLDLNGADPMRGASITWADVSGLLERAQQSAPPELALIAAELGRAIVDHILPAVIDPAEFAYVTEIAGPLLDGIVTTLESDYPATLGASSLSVAEDFARRYIRLRVHGHPLQLLARLSPGGGRYNLHDRPATIMLQFMTDANETLPAELVPIAISCGMQATRNRAGYTGLRRFIDLPPGLSPDEAAQLGIQLANELVGALPAA